MRTSTTSSFLKSLERRMKRETISAKQLETKLPDAIGMLISNMRDEVAQGNKSQKDLDDFIQWLQEYYPKECDRREVKVDPRVLNMIGLEELPPTEALPEKIPPELLKKRASVVLSIDKDLFNSIRNQEQLGEKDREIKPHWKSRLERLEPGDILELRAGFTPLARTLWAVYQGMNKIEKKKHMH